MRNAMMFARKEAFEIVRTWRIYVLPAIFLLFAITGPFIAKYTPELLTTVGGGQFASLELPEPTAYDAYKGWINNLSQIGLFAIIIIYGGIVSGERRTGSAILVLTKPVSRTAFVVVKVAVQAVYVAVLLVLGTVVTWGVSALVFGNAPAAAIWSSALVWLVLALVYLCALTLLSVVISSAAGAAGAGLGLFVVLAAASLWGPLAEYSPAGLAGTASTLATGGDVERLFWPVTVSVAISIVLVGIAAQTFRRQEI